MYPSCKVSVLNKTTMLHNLQKPSLYSFKAVVNPLVQNLFPDISPRCIVSINVCPINTAHVLMRQHSSNLQYRSTYSSHSCLPLPMPISKSPIRLHTPLGCQCLLSWLPLTTNLLKGSCFLTHSQMYHDWADNGLIQYFQWCCPLSLAFANDYLPPTA